MKKNLLKFVSLFFLLLTGNFVFGQVYQRGVITYVNGDVRVGNLMIPEIINQKTIKFKQSGNNSQIEKIASTDLKSISVESEDGNKYHFDRILIAVKPGSKPMKQPFWLLAYVTGYATLYIYANYYDTDKIGNVRTLADHGLGVGNIVGPATYFYCLRKGNQNIAYSFGIENKSIIPINRLKVNAERYFSDYPELVERINNNELKGEDIIKIIDMYNEHMKNNNPIQDF